MSPKESPESPVPETSGEDPHVALERMLISEYLRERGYSLQKLHDLPVEEARALMIEASKYASTKLAELEDRARLVNEIHEAAHTD